MRHQRRASSCLRSAIPAKRAHGWSLVELMLVLAVGGVLSILAMPSWQAQVFKGRRVEAVEALQGVALAQARWRASHPGFTADVGSAEGLNLAPLASTSNYVTRSGDYRVEVRTDAATERHRFEATATATPGGAVARDAMCRSLSLLVDGGVLTQSAVPAVNARRCWGR